MHVAVLPTWFVQMSSHYVVHMVSVRNGFMTTLGTVTMTIFMTCTFVFRSARASVCAAFGETVLVYVIVVHVMQMAVMQIICMFVMFYRLVSAGRSMLMLMFFMCGAGHILLRV